jgi:serine phosphatase RsbU (regulator of sigma subunit)
MNPDFLQRYPYTHRDFLLTTRSRGHVAVRSLDRLREFGVATARVRWSAGRLVPLVVIVAVCVIDFAGGPSFVIIALVVIAPLLAATLVGPRLTGVYALGALAGAGAVGVSDQLQAPDAGGGRLAMAIRLAGIAFGGGVAVAASRARQARERRLTALVRVAEVAQRAILSPVPTAVGDIRFATTYQSAGAEASIGGDLYEVVDSRWGIRLIVGDVRGKGLEAVRLASRVLGSFRALAGRLEDLGELVEALDCEVAGFVRRGEGGEGGGEVHWDGEDFVTAVVAQVDRTGRMLLLNAGHPDPLLVRGGNVEVLGVGDRQPPLGLGAAPDAIRVHVSGSDRLLFYTDGLVEARHPATREFFPLVPAVRAAFGGGELPDALARLVAGLVDWAGGSLGDDVAIVAAERLG